VASSEVEICNKALARAGVNSFITALDNATAEAASCRVLYPPCRDALLATSPWPFAKRRATLAPLSNVTRTGYLYAFLLPADCLVVREIWSGHRRPRADQRIPYAIHNAVDGRILCTDLSAPDIEYTARVTNVTLYHPLFEEALTWALAADLALSLAKDIRQEQLARVRSEQMLTRAQAVALSEDQMDVEPQSELITIRGVD